MKKMRKIIPALAMLLVSAVMLSTASFAWFSTNKDVTASGMAIKATSEGGLVIATTTGEITTLTASTFAASDFKTAVDFKWNNGATSINPTSLDTSAVDGTAKWWKAIAASPLEHTGSGYAEVSSTNYSSYFYRTQCVVKSLSETAGTLYLDSITVTGANTLPQLDASLRVAVKVGTQWTVFAPKRTAAPDGGFKCYTGSVSAATVNPASNASGEYTTNIEIGALQGASETQVPTLVDIYVYFEGEDPACMSANVQSLETLTISVKFSSDQSDS